MGVGPVVVVRVVVPKSKSCGRGCRCQLHRQHQQLARGGISLLAVWRGPLVVSAPRDPCPCPWQATGVPKSDDTGPFCLGLGLHLGIQGTKKTPRQWRKEKCTTQLALRNRVCRSGLIHDIPHQVPILVGTASLAMTIPIAKVTHSDTWTHHNWSIIRFIHQATVSPIARQILNKQADTLSLPGPSIYILPKDDQISYFDHQASKDLSPHPVTTSLPP